MLNLCGNSISEINLLITDSGALVLNPTYSSLPGCCPDNQTHLKNLLLQELIDLHSFFS